MKKKIITLCLVIAMLSVAVIGGTLAYFTDVDRATNEFTVGGVKIDLYETVGHKDGANNPKAAEQTLGKATADADPIVNHKYESIMPGDTLKKVVTVENTDSEAVYVALSIVQNNYGTGKMTPADTWFNERIDNYYEGKISDEELAALGLLMEGKGLPAYNGADMQSLTSRIFTGTGWGTPAYNKLDKNGNPTEGTLTPVSNMRYYPTTIAGIDQDGSESFVGREGVQIIAVDYAVANQGEHNGNMMQNGADGKNVYDEMEAGSRIWVYYLYLPAETSIDFDLTINVPVEIDEYSIAAFNNMKLDVRAAAIQVSGFETAKDAFIALEKVYSFNYDLNKGE